MQQEYQNTIGSSTNGHTFILTLDDLENGGTVAVTATLASPADTTAAAAQIAAAYTASAEGLFKEITFTSSGAVLIIKPKVAGRPISVNSYSGGTGTWTTTVSATVITPNGGPYDLLDERNYLENDAPGASDNVFFLGNASPLYRTYQNATTFAKITFAADWSGTTGPLNMPNTGLEVNGRGVLRFNMGSSNVPVTINGTASLPNGAPAAIIFGSNISTFTVNGGSCALAPNPGETSTAATININGPARFVGGAGVTNTTFNQNHPNSYVVMDGDGATYTGNSGTAVIGGSSAWATITSHNAKVTVNTTGTVSQATSTDPRGYLDFNASVTARTITNGTSSGYIYAGSHITRTNTFVENRPGAVLTGYINGVSPSPPAS